MEYGCVEVSREAVNAGGLRKLHAGVPREPRGGRL